MANRRDDASVATYADHEIITPPQRFEASLEQGDRIDVFAGFFALPVVEFGGFQ